MDIVVFILLVVAVVWFVRRRTANRRHSARPVTPVAPRPSTASARPPVRTTPRPQRHIGTDRGDRMPFAEPGMRGPLFSYAEMGRRRGRYQHAGPYAVVDVETTGFSPGRGDRVIEIAVARVDASGRIEDEYATLVNPEGRDTGAVWVHRISNEMVATAPTFAEVAGEVLSRLDGAVVVAHNAVFEERFLAAELHRIGLRRTAVPALCSLWLGQRSFDTPNHKLSTIARHAGVPMPDAHAALGDVRAVAQILPRMLDMHGTSLSYRRQPGEGLCGDLEVGARPPVTRAVNLRKGEDGWMASLLARLPSSGHEGNDAATAVYLDALEVALEDGRIIGDEAKTLARIAGGAGMGAAQVAALNEHFLERMREVALADDVLTTAELRQLNRTAGALGVPDYFDDLVAAPSSAASPHGSHRGVATATTTTASSSVRRCGHCRTPGHYRTTCPELT